ncbi:MAG: FAD-dependent oxidoreductase [Dehalococcoidia bacterium]|nr:FAD-dependent oxidoreductase [Chloroflexi bacterium CFX7]NUQ54660.1 FAD-dependent oxidoreductase [Dehalococcoidia bacterium]
MPDVDVVVVGAGFAGLTAARRIAEKGATVAVLEARERVGGRTHTVDVAGVPLDLGGMWVGPGQSALHALATELGVRTATQVMVGDNVVVLDGQPYRGGRVVEVLAGMFGQLQAATAEFEALVHQVSPDEPWASPGAEELDSMTLSSWLDARMTDSQARLFFEMTVNSVFATGSANMSVLGAAIYAASSGGWSRLTGTSGGAQQDRFVGGVEQMARMLAERLGNAVRLGFPVTRVSCQPGEVRASGERGAVAGRRAIVAVSPMLSGRIAFDPPLPARRDQLVQRLPAGSVIKFHVVYDSPWWRSEGLSGQVIAPGAPVSVTFDTSPPGAGVVTGFFEGRHAVAAGLQSAAERRATVIDLLALALGERARECVDYVDLDWSAEPWTRGCYGAHFPPGVLTTYGPALREPCGPIHWAGTETSTRSIGYIDGAIRSGERAAAEVLAALG